MVGLAEGVKSIYKRSLTLIALIGVVMASGCALKKDGAEPKTMRVNLGAEPPGLDWGIETDLTSFDVVSNLMTGLTQYTPDLTCAPSCAKSWEVLDNGKRYLFHLRNDVYWTDGKKLVAKDFEYAWLRLLDPNTASQYAYFLYPIENAFAYNTGKLKDPSLVGIKALDDFTFEVKLTEPAAYFIYLTAYCPTCPMRKDLVEKWGRKWTEPENLVTNGPFMLSHWAHEYKIELVANPKFFEGRPRLDRIKMFMVPEQATAFALYENDELDYVDNRSFSTPDVERNKSSPEYHNIALLRNDYIGFNVTKKPFDDARVRKAVSMAIDRSQFPLILRRNERPSYSWIPQPLAGYSAQTGLRYDLPRARQLLEEAGYPGGKGFPEVEMLGTNREDSRLISEEIQDQLRQHLGIKIGLETHEWRVYLQTMHRDAPPIFKSMWEADYPDPETFSNLFTSHNGNNYTCWHNAKYDSMVKNACGEQDKEKRAQLYQTADQYLCDDEVPIAPIFRATQNVMVKPWVKGLKFNALDVTFFKEVSIEPQH